MKRKLGSFWIVLLATMTLMVMTGGCGGGSERRNEYTPPRYGGETLTVTPSVLFLRPGETALLLADNIRGNLTWMSQNPSVSVLPTDERTAKVTALALGETGVLVFDGSGAEAVCHITVTDEVDPMDPIPVPPLTPW
jgi:hypothetical protein